MITEDYVGFETAKLLKEKGFDENTSVNYFVGDGKPRGCVVGEMIYHKRHEGDMHLIACPTLQMAMKWLWEMHKLFIELKMSIDLIGNPHYAYSVLGFDGKYKRENYTSFDWMFKDACEAAIKYCIENLI